METVELTSAPGKIIGQAREDFHFEQEVIRSQQKVGFNISRGLETNANNEGYLDILPTFEGKRFDQLIDEEIQRRIDDSTQTRNPFRPITIVDVGYGAGNFLLDCQNRWGDKVHLVGYGTELLTMIPVDELNGTVSSPTHNKLTSSKIELVNGDILDIKERLATHADFLVSSNVMQYINYPRWELVKKLYRVLNPSGIALVDGLEINKTQRAALNAYLKTNGYQFELGDGIAFKKTQTDITLPIRSVGEINSGFVRITVT